MRGGCSGVVDPVGAVVVGKTYADGLVDAHQVPEEIPRPRIFCSFEVIFIPFDIDRPHLIEAAELAGSARSALQPYNQGHGLIFPGQGVSLPERIVDGGFGVGEDVLVPCEGLVEQSLAGLFVVEVGGVGDAGGEEGEEEGEAAKD